MRPPSNEPVSMGRFILGDRVEGPDGRHGVVTDFTELVGSQLVWLDFGGGEESGWTLAAACRLLSRKTAVPRDRETSQ